MTYSELISIHLIAKQANELLFKNNDLGPTGFKSFLEANAGSSNFGHSKSHEPHLENFSRKNGEKSNHDRNNSQKRISFDLES